MSEFPLWSELIRQALPSQDAPKTGEKLSVKESREVAPSLKKQDGYALVAIENNKVHPNSMAWDLNATEVVLYANMLRTKHPQATISIEAKGGRISQVLKPGELFKESYEVVPSLKEARMPLEGHPYHKKSDDELRYIIKDAGAAALAMRGHNRAAEDKYVDQVNDAQTVLYYRKNGGLKGATHEVELKPGTRVKTPHGRGKIVRYDKGDGPHGSPYYIVDVGKQASEKVMAHQLQREETMIGPGSRVKTPYGIGQVVRYDKVEKLYIVDVGKKAYAKVTPPTWIVGQTKKVKPNQIQRWSEQREAAEPQPEFSSGNQTARASGWPPGLKLAAIKSYREKEKNNDHTGNALFVTRMFGKPQEIAIVQKLWDIRAKEGGIDASKHQSLISAVEVLHSKYHRQLMSLKEENEDSDSDYQEYFKKMLQKHNYDSPADIPDDKKDDFFNAVDAGYTAKDEATTPGAAHAAYYKQHKITHTVAKKDLAAHKEWMDSEGFDTHTVPLSDNDRNAKTHVGVVSKGNVESSYHVDGFAEPIKEGYLKEDKKPYVWECMDCGNIWRSTQSGNTRNVSCPKCHSDDVLPGKFISDRAGYTEENEDSDSDYQEYFKKMLQKHGYDSPADIPDDKKDDFFNAVDTGYDAKNEEVDPNVTDERDSDDQEMMSAQVDSLVDKSAELHDILNQLKLADVPAWIQSKVSTADTDINSILDYMKYEEKHPVAEDVSDNQGMDRARSMAKSAAAAPFQQRLPTMKEPVVPMRMQAAMVVAKALGSVRGTGQSADFKVSSSSPEALVNQALRVWLSGSHTNEGWALGAKMLKLAKEMGIKWDEKLVRSKLAPITLKKLGLDEAESAAVVGVSNAEKLTQRQETEKETLALRHNKEKTSQAQRDGEEKIRKQAAANAQTRTSK